ncbi:YmfQ family protein [Paraburkholderia largidicola]|uniref:Tail protein n=1 Tax=Paraburkholderia largidicola TaxID=3014751 RepID=A0A7I8BJ65_9BURK|nr:putative phage tail protein [Paraburkholderia sp. PGU16]BCF88662.1 tail protein [Paraburkholderia sp. PGU16]
MLAPNLTSADFLSVLQALMPRGRVWPRDGDAVQTKTLAGCAPTFARLTARSNQLLVDGFPTSAYEVLPEWESSLGLPDPCAGAAPTVPQRQQQVVARFANSGGQSLGYFIDFAAALGYSVVIEQYTQARAGLLKAGDPVNGYDWNFAWKIKAPLNTVVRAVAGAMAAGDPLAAWGNNVLECEFNAVKPAHTIPIFAYA